MDAMATTHTMLVSYAMDLRRNSHLASKTAVESALMRATWVMAGVIQVHVKQS
jgi:hypothetical protein